MVQNSHRMLIPDNSQAIVNFENYTQKRLTKDEFVSRLTCIAYYVQSARFYPKNTEYYLVWENHAFPSNLEVFDLTTDGMSAIRSSEYEETMKSARSVMTLWKEKNNELKKVQEIFLPEYGKGFFKFSSSGDRIVLSGKTSSELYVYDSSDLLKMMDYIKNNQHVVSYKSPKFKGIRKICFSNDDKMLCLGFEKEIDLYDITSDSLHPAKKYEIPDIYSELINLRLTNDGTDAMLCCKRDGWRNVDAFFMGRDNVKDYRSIRYDKFKHGARLTVKISKDFKTIFLNTGKESILLKENKQQILKWFGEKHVLKMATVDDGFFGVACNGYDIEIDVMHTSKPEFKAHIPRKQIPGLNKFFDMKATGDTIKILSVRGDEEFVDIVNSRTGQITSHRSHAYKNFNFQWPYICCIAQDKDILIFNAFKTNQVLRIQARPESEIDRSDETIVSLDLTANMNLFYITKKDSNFKCYVVDLDNFRLSLTPLFQYKASEVDNKNIFCMHVRSSSAKETADFNLETMVLIQHEFGIYLWSEETKLKKLLEMQSMTDIQSMEEGQFYVQEQVEKQSIIKKITMDYSSYELTEIYREKEEYTSVRNYELDAAKTIYMLVRYKNGPVRKYFLKVYDTVEQKITYKIEVRNKDVIGSFLSGNFYIVNGIFYFQNTIIKINFDNVNGMGEEYQDNVFQVYKNVLKLNPGQSIPYECPIMTFAFRRLLYTIKDSKKFLCKQGVILPFLDEKRLYFNSKDKITQFCTLVENEDTDMHPKQILCINPYENRMMTYSLKGEYLSGIKYDTLAEKYGEPISVSHNGMNMIFRKKNTTVFSTIAFSTDGPRFVKQYDLHTEYVQNSKLQEHFSAFDFEANQVKNLIITAQINNNLDVLFSIRKQDVKQPAPIGLLSNMFPSKNKNQVYVDDDDELEVINSTTFAFYKGTWNGDMQVKDYVFSTEDLIQPISSFTGYSLSLTQVIFWSKSQVHYLKLKTQVLKKISISIRDEDVNCYIKGVDVSGYKEDRCVITMSQSETLDSIVFWSLDDKDIELDSFDCSPSALIFFDKRGYDYILDQNEVIMVRMGARSLAYKMSVDDFDANYLFKGIEYGHRVDPHYMDYIVIRNFIAIPCSYFNLIYLDANHGKDISDANFDADGSVYIINQQTELHELVVNYESLEYILNKYEERDVKLLESLVFCDTSKETPLHVAITSKSNRSINILLQKLARVNLNNSGNLRNIFDDLLEYHSFSEYLNLLYFKTLQMKSLQTLKMSSSEESLVVPHSNSYLDNKFYDKIQGNKLGHTVNRPVTVKAIDVWWIFNYPQGVEFLNKLAQVDNVNFLTAETTKIIIEYMWKHYSIRILSYILVPYLCYFGLFLVLILFNERYFSEAGSEGAEEYNYEGSERQGIIAICVLTLIFLSYQMYILVRRFIFLKWSYLRSMWSWLDLISACLNIAIIAATLGQNGVRQIRQIESVATILMWMKFLYFLRILSSTAPLVRMIQEIFKDIRAFVVMFSMGIFMMANAFYLLGKNVDQFDQEQLEASGEEITFKTYKKAIIYVYLTVIGDFQYGMYGESSDTPLLWIFFFITTFYVLIVLLNMLIAIMGATFGRVEEVAEGAMLRERMQLIMENQFLPSLKDMKRTKYLIAIEAADDENEDEQLLNQVDEKITNLVEEFRDFKKSFSK